MMETDNMIQAKKKGRKALKVLLWIVGIVAVLMIVAQIVLSPALLTKIVNNVADEYIDGEVDFGKVSVSVIKSFPYLNVTLDSVTVTYPTGRFAGLEKEDGPRLLRMGKGEVQDTLAHFNKFSVSLNLPALIGGTVHIPNIELNKPRIFAKSYNDSTANWNIFRTEADTLAVKDSPADAYSLAGADSLAAADSIANEKEDGKKLKITLERIALDGRPFIVYCSSKDTLFAAVRLKEMKFRGRFSTKDPQRNRFGFMVDSLFVGGRLSSDTLALSLQKLRFREQRGDFALQAKARAALATKSAGRVFLPIDMDAKVSLLRDTVPSFSVKKLTADIAGVPLEAKADIKYMTDSIFVKGNAAINKCKVNDVLKFWGKNFFPALADLKTGATVSLTADIDGWYNMDGSRIPAVDAALLIPESPISHSGIRMDSNIAADIRVKGGGADPVNVGINDFHMRGKALNVNLTGSAADLLGKDPLFKFDGDLSISLDTLAQFVSKKFGYDLSGRLAADAEGKIRMSQISPRSFAEADLKAVLKSDNLNVYSPKDSIDLHIDSLDVLLATVGNTRDSSIAEGTRMLAAVASLDSTRIRYKEAFSVTGGGLLLKAHNDADILDADKSADYYAFGGKLEIGNLALTSSDSTTVSLHNSTNIFKISPSVGDSSVPVLSLDSDSGTIRLLSGFNRLAINELNLDLTATKSDARRKRMAKAFVDSLAKIYPEVPRDSLMGHLRKTASHIALPEWLSEEDFRKKDINLKLDESLAKYFREWDFHGDMKFKNTIVMTPMFPLRTGIVGFDGHVTNNELSVNSFDLLSGRSTLGIKGNLSGLRGALLRGGPLDLKMNITSISMNINELMGALSMGQKFMEMADTLSAAASTVSDEEYEKMVTVESIETDTIPDASLIVVPANLKADISLTALNVVFSKMKMSSLSAKMSIRERCIRLTDTKAKSNVGNLSFDGFYSTRTKEDLSAGFNLSLNNITAEKIIEMVPAVDTLMPMLQSFYGKLDCDLAATTQIDTNMNLVMPSLNGIIRVKGKNLALVESEDLYKIARILKIKDAHNIKIDDMSVEGIIGDNRVEIFPFVLSVDKYSLALSGIQNMDQSFNYHISVVKSPLLIRFGVDLWGPDFDNMKFKLGKAKYKDTNVPVFSSVIDETQYNLLQSIRNIYSKGVEAAIQETVRKEAVTKYKQRINYRNAAETAIEDLSKEEAGHLGETSGAEEGAATDSTAAEAVAEGTDTVALSEAKDSAAVN